MLNFIPLKAKERHILNKALHRNVEDNIALLVGKDTSFAGTSDEVKDISDEEVVFVIKSIPCHY